jgi:phage terminase large subunit
MGETGKLKMLIEAVNKITLWRKDPIQFVIDNFNVVPDEWQKKALIAFASKDEKCKRIALQACAGPGKTTVLAWAGLNFLACYGLVGDHPKGACVAITQDNLRDNLWAEFAKWMNVSKFLSENFTWTKSRIAANCAVETWFLSARSFSRSANQEEMGRTLSGIHSGFVLFLLDEAGDINPAVLKAAEQAMSAEYFGKILLAGNPTSTTGILYQVATQLSEHWTRIKITSDPDDIDRTPRVDAAWAAQQIKTYGRDDPWVKSYILGEFPEGGINTLLSLAEVEAAMGRQPHPGTYEHVQKRLGVDCARFGADSSVIFPRQGLAAYTPVEMRGARSNEIAARVATLKNDWGSEVEMVDGSGGFGSGVVDSLLQSGYAPIEVSFAGKPTDARYYNTRAEMWFKMAEWIKRGGCLPNVERLKRELVAPTYSFKNGRFILEDKDQIKKRLGFSVDFADALALTFFMPDMPASNPLIEKRSSALIDKDPFS